MLKILLLTGEVRPFLLIQERHKIIEPRSKTKILISSPQKDNAFAFMKLKVLHYNIEHTDVFSAMYNISQF